ncbi:MAG: hypothetical protein ACKVOH_02600, partial [Chlamydiales bacterium]
MDWNNLSFGLCASDSEECLQQLSGFSHKEDGPRFFPGQKSTRDVTKLSENEVIKQKTQVNRVAIIVGARTSFVDHIVPLCAAFRIPLYCEDSWVAFCAETFYPEIEVTSEPLDSYDTYLYVEPYRLHEKAFLFGNQLISEKKFSISSFHGNSNKGRSSYWVERFAHDDMLLYYGPFMEKFFREKGVWDRIPHHV